MFKHNFPILFLVAFSRESSQLTSQVLSIGFKEIFENSGFYSSSDLKTMKEQYMTDKQSASFTEKAILALYQIIKGDDIDM